METNVDVLIGSSIVGGFPDYIITQVGKVYTRKLRNGKVSNPERWREVKQETTWSGYKRVELFADKKKYRRSVHRLVLENFVGPCPSGMEACHEDGDRTNNELTNLRWDTPQKNWEDRKRHGRGNLGEENNLSKLTTEEVKEILKLRTEGYTTTRLGEMFGVSASNISQISSGKIWKHIEEYR